MANDRSEHLFTCSALPDDTFRVVRFRGTETISQPYRFEIELSTADPDVEIGDMVDAASALTMAPSFGSMEYPSGLEPHPIHGIVIDVEAVGTAAYDHDEVFVYRAVLVPHLWRLSLSFQSRIFQNLTVEEIVGSVLGDANVEHEFRLSASYEPREFTTQYKETDLAFIQRLLEYEGIRYHFEQGDAAETLVISDAAEAPDIPGEAPDVTFYRAGGLMVQDGEETISAFSSRHRLVSGTAETADYNYRTPSTKLHATEDTEGKPSEGIQSDSMVHTDTPARTDRITRLRAEEIETTRRVMKGASDRRGVRAGHQFTLVNHHRDALNQTYLVTSVEHVGSVVPLSDVLESDAEALPHYENAFTTVPASVTYRPPRVTPEPKLPGVLTAKVESAGGDYAPIDDQGRYRVRFPFDLGTAGEAQATKPVRLAQPYSGPGYGQHFPVHKDAEMVVACVDGNVDRIIGLSTVPNPNQASPVTSENQTENTVLTAANNRIMMQDLKGAVGIDISTPSAKSRIHLGAHENAVQGIQITTDATQTLHAGKGLFIKTGGVVEAVSAATASKDIQDFGAKMTLADALVSAGLVALGIDSLDSSSVAQDIVNVIVGTKVGLDSPGVYVVSEGGVMMMTPGAISAYAGAGGIGLTTATGIDMASGDGGINLINGRGGINMAVGMGDIQTVTGKGDIKTEAKIGEVDTTARKAVKLTSKKDNIELLAEEKDVTLEAKKENVKVTADKNVEVKAKKNVEIEYSDDFTVKKGKKVLIEGSSEIKFKCGGASITLKPSGEIVLKGMKVKIDAGPTKAEFGPAGIKAEGIQMELEGKATAKLKGGAMTTVEAGAMLKLKGGITMIG